MGELSRSVASKRGANNGRLLMHENQQWSVKQNLHLECAPMKFKIFTFLKSGIDFNFKFAIKPT